MILPVCSMDFSKNQTNYSISKTQKTTQCSFKAVQSWGDTARIAVRVHDAIRLLNLDNIYKVENCNSHADLINMKKSIFRYIGSDIEQQLSNIPIEAKKTFDPNKSRYCMLVKNPEYGNNKNVLLKDKAFLKTNYEEYGYKKTDLGYLVSALANELYYSAIGGMERSHTEFSASEIPQLFIRRAYENKELDHKFYNSDLFAFINNIADNTETFNITADSERRDLIIPDYCTNGIRDTWENRTGYNLARNKAIALLLSKHTNIDLDRYARATMLINKV